MGKLIFRIVEPNSKSFADPSIFDACIDPQFNGVFPDDPSLGIVSERKANDRTNSPASRDSRQGKDHQR
mgnify:CR=1 FL=1